MITVASRTIGSTGLAVSEIGFGGAPLGNLYQVISDSEAQATLQRALDSGINYVDTAPYYGFGLSERRAGDVLRERDGIVLSTKVGRLLKPLLGCRGDAERHGFRSPMPFAPGYDYSHDGIMRSFEDSLQRLGLSQIDILYVHDIGSLTHGADHDQKFRDLTTGGGFRALERLRECAAIKAFGLGVNEWQICLQAMEHTSLDVVLLAGRYTLLDQSALDSFLPACAASGVSVVIGGPYNSGILATGTRSVGIPCYDYAPASTAIVERVRKIEAVCDRHGVALATAALTFPLAHPCVVSVIPGLGTPRRVDQTLQLYRAQVPYAFWEELKAAGLLRMDAPVPLMSRAW